MVYAAIIAAVAAVIGALIANGQENQAQALRQQTADKYKDLPLPVLDKVVAQKLPPDAAARWMAGTKATQTQGDVLDKYNEVINEKGETADDRAAYLRMQQAAGGIANATQGAVQRGMADRGLAGSGMSFALQQQGAQSAVNRANEMGIQAAADARGRYMDALGKAGGLASDIRGQDQNAMHAQDSINEFNARQQSDADFRNQQIPQQQFDNRMTKLAGEANANNGVASGYERGADTTRSAAAGVGNAALTAGNYKPAKDELTGESTRTEYDENGRPIRKKPGYRESAGAA